MILFLDLIEPNVLFSLPNLKSPLTLSQRTKSSIIEYLMPAYLSKFIENLYCALESI